VHDESTLIINYLGTLRHKNNKSHLSLACFY